MKNIIFLTLVFALMPFNLFAQTDATEQVNCFDYYKFGSVHTSLEVKNKINVSGTKVDFVGEIKNDNPYPIVDGKVFVKIMRKNGDYSRTSGQDEVDSFVVKSGVSIKASSSIPLSFSWDIPAYAVSGDYQVSTFFLIGDSFNMSGLSFTTDIVGGAAKFKVIGEQKSKVYFDRTKMTMNGKDYYTVAFTPTVGANEMVNISLTLTNTTDAIQRVPVSFELYKWDAQSSKNLLKTEEIIYLIKPKTSINVPYTINDISHSVYYLLAKASYMDTKSEVAVRFERKDKQEPRINFTSFVNYPLEKGGKNKIVTCVHNTNSVDAEFGNVITTVYDNKGGILHQSQYEGKVSSRIQGLMSNFTPDYIYKDLSIETVIFDKQGAIIDEVKVTYKCSDFFDDCSESVPKTFSFFSLNIIYIISGIIFILIIVLLIYRSTKNKTKSFRITTLFVITLLSVCINPKYTDAKSTTWQKDAIGPITTLEWREDSDRFDSYAANNVSVFVDYHSSVYNVTKKEEVVDDSVINPGDKLRFTFTPNVWQDIFWVGLGGAMDSPYGDWVPNGGMTLTCDYEKYLISVGSWISQTEMQSAVFGQFSVNPPSKKIINTDNLTCSKMVVDSSGDYMDCTVNPISSDVPVVINPAFEFGETYGKFYFTYAGGSCGATSPSRLRGFIDTIYEPLEYIETIPAQTIPFALSIQPASTCSVNSAPSAPTVSLSSSEAVVDKPLTIIFSSHDEEGDPLTYQIDWGDGVVTTEISPLEKTWTTTGVKTIKIRATDGCGGQSSWVTKTIVVNDSVVSVDLGNLIVTSTSGCDNITLNWNNNGATYYEIYRKNGALMELIGSSVSGTSYTDTKLANGSPYVYQIRSVLGTKDKYGSEVTVLTTKDCPCSEYSSCVDGFSVNYKCPGYTVEKTTTACGITSPVTFQFKPNTTNVGGACKLFLEATNVSSCYLKNKSGQISVPLSKLPVVDNKISIKGEVSASVGTHTLWCSGVDTSAPEMSYGTKTCYANPSFGEE